MFWKIFELLLFAKSLDFLFLRKFQLNALYIYVLCPFSKLILRNYAVFHLTDQ